MAIKVGGTEVVSDARALSNITSIDATTAAAIGAGGVGGGGEVDFTASGAISNGDLVKLNSDGTVSVIQGGGTGSPAVYLSQYSTKASAVFDSNSNKVVLAYKDETTSYGAAVVGTVSGSSISFGTPVVFKSVNVTGVAATFDSNSNKVVICWRDNFTGFNGNAIVGTVSGTSISFGSSTTFNAAGTLYISATFDSNSNKVVIAYRDDGNSNYGTAVVGTVSGTSISFGTPVVYNSAYVNYASPVFDTNSNKVVIAFADGGQSNFGKAIVGTVSGTSISFGTEVQYIAAQNNNPLSTVFDTNSNKVVIAVPDTTNNKGKAVVGTVSGTSISFGTPVLFEDGISTDIAATFDSNVNKVIIAYRDQSNTNTGRVIVGSVDGTSLNFLPASTYDDLGYSQISTTFDSNSNKTVIAYQDGGNSNYGTALTYSPTDVFEWVGFASADVSDGSTATINVVSGINEGQTGLTTGSKYYLPDDGTLTTTATDGREVGRAIAADKILITQGSVS